jgi:hypothetical protein
VVRTVTSPLDRIMGQIGTPIQPNTGPQIGEEASPGG